MQRLKTGHWTPFLVPRTQRQSKQENKKSNPTLFFQDGSTWCWVSSSHFAQEQLVLTHSGKKQVDCGRGEPPYLGNTALKWHVEVWTFVRAVKLTAWKQITLVSWIQATCRDWVRVKPVHTQTQLPPSTHSTLALLPCLETHQYPVKETPSHRLSAGKGKSGKRLLICRIVFSSMQNVSKSNFMLLQLVIHMESLFLKLHRKDLRTQCINMHVST